MQSAVHVHDLYLALNYKISLNSEFFILGVENKDVMHRLTIVRFSEKDKSVEYL